MRKRNNKFVQLQRKIDGKPLPNLSRVFKVGDTVRVVSIERSTRKLGRPNLSAGYIGEIIDTSSLLSDSIQLRVCLGSCKWVLAEECEHA